MDAEAQAATDQLGAILADDSAPQETLSFDSISAAEAASFQAEVENEDSGDEEEPPGQYEVDENETGDSDTSPKSDVKQKKKPRS